MTNWIGFVVGLAVVGWTLFILLAVTMISIYKVHKSHNKVCRKNQREAEVMYIRNKEVKEACTTLLTMLYDLVLTENKDDIAYKAGVIRSSLFLDGMLNRSDYSIETLQTVLATMDTADVDTIVKFVMRIANHTYNYDPDNVAEAVEPDTHSKLDKFLQTIDKFFDEEEVAVERLRGDEWVMQHDETYQKYLVTHNKKTDVPIELKV